MNTYQKASEVLKDVRYYWKSLQGKYYFWKSGFAVFYSPVKENPEYMLIGINPGGDKGAFDEERELKIRSEHEYFVETYPLARKMRALFEKAGLERELKESVKTNLIFFRSECFRKKKNCNDVWNNIEPNLRQTMESFCKEKILELIEIIKPRIILAESLYVFDRLLGMLHQKTQKLSDQFRFSKRGRLYQSFLFEDFYVRGIIGISHLTGSFLSHEEKLRLVELLENDSKVFLQ